VNDLDEPLTAVNELANKMQALSLFGKPVQQPKGFTPKNLENLLDDALIGLNDYDDESDEFDPSKAY
jgi:hypothetical protein